MELYNGYDMEQNTVHLRNTANGLVQQGLCLSITHPRRLRGVSAF